MPALTDLDVLTKARTWAGTGVARKIRENVGASRREYGAECGLSAETIRAYESGRRRPRGQHGVAYGRLLVKHAGLGAGRS